MKYPGKTNSQNKENVVLNRTVKFSLKKAILKMTKAITNNIPMYFDSLIIVL